MFVTTILSIVLAGFIFILSRSLSNSWKNKSIDTGRRKNNSVQYISKGLGYTLKLGILTFRASLKNSSLKGTVFHELYKEYGSPNAKNSKSTFIIKSLNTTTVDVKDYNSVMTLLSHDCVTDKTSKQMMEYFFMGPPKGIIFNCGEEGKELRRYTMKTLGRLGFGKHKKMSHILNEQLLDLLENFDILKEQTGNKIPIQDIFSRSVINVVWCLVGGKQFHRGDEQFLNMYKNAEEISTFNVMLVMLMDHLPKRLLLSLDRFGAGYQHFFNCIKDLKTHFLNFIEEKQLQLDEDNPLDFTDHFLLEIKKYQNNEQLNKLYNKDQLAVVLSDLLVAGMDTTSKYMESAFMFMALNPAAQLKVQEEIDSVIEDCLPSYADHKKSMPFTQATIMEIHRMANIIPFIIRKVNKDFEFDGQQFKKETMVLNSAYYFRMDESYWGDPEIFRPERFLDAENNLILDKMNHVVPFGAGPRVCLGENVATYTIFSFFVGLLQRYCVTRSNPNEVLGLAKGFALVSRPEPFHVTLLPRLDK